MTRAYLFKLFRSPLTYIAIIGTAALCFTNGIINRDFYVGTVAYHVDLFLHLDAYRKLLPVFGALPFTANFADEWKSGVTINCALRRGVKKYAAANVLFCAATSLLTVVLGMLLYAFIYSLFIPLYAEYTDPFTFLLGRLLTGGLGWLYMIFQIFIFACSCSMWAVMGMLLSALMPNKYVAIASPFVASYIVERITIQFPPRLNLWLLSLAAMEWKSDLAGVLYTVGIFAAISTVCGILFYIVVRKRVRNEIS